MKGVWFYITCYYCSVTQLCLTLCNPMDFSMPGFPVLHYLPELLKFMSIGLVTLCTHLLFCSLLLLLSIFPSIRVFSDKSALHIRWTKYWSCLVIHWNPAFSWVYLSLFPLLFAYLLSSAICKVSWDNHFAFLQFFFFGMVFITAFCTMLWTSVHSYSGTLSIRYNPLNLFITSTV